MELPKLSFQNVAIAGVLGYFLYPKLMRFADKTTAFISQKVLQTKFNGPAFNIAGKLQAKFTTSVEIANRNKIPFPIQDLSVKLYYLDKKSGQKKLVGENTPNFERYVIPSANADGTPGIARIANIELFVDPKQVPGILTGLTKGLNMEVVSSLKVYGVAVSSTSPYTI